MIDTMASHEIWDMHCHIFPEKIADKAADAIGRFYDIPMRYSGKSEVLLESGAQIGVTHYLVCSSATVSEQVESINSFIASECEDHPEFMGYGTLHPDMAQFEPEVKRIISLGLKGIKLHPDFQRFAIDSPRAIEMYRVASEYGLPFLFHTGDKRYDYSSPKRLASAMDKVPGLVAIGAHFGGYSEWEQVADCLTRENVYFDTSSTLFELPPDKAVKLLRTLGVEKFFFGVDFPMWDHADELRRFNCLPLTDKERDLIFSENARRFMEKHKPLDY